MKYPDHELCGEIQCSVCREIPLVLRVYLLKTLQLLQSRYGPKTEFEKAYEFKTDRYKREFGEH